jgi:hypothetical protein
MATYPTAPPHSAPPTTSIGVWTPTCMRATPTTTASTNGTARHQPASDAAITAATANANAVCPEGKP